MRVGRHALAQHLQHVRRRPQTLGKCERFWGTLWREVRRDGGVLRVVLMRPDGEVQELRIELQAARVRTEIALTMPHLLHRGPERDRKKNRIRPKPKK